MLLYAGAIPVDGRVDYGYGRWAVETEEVSRKLYAAFNEHNFGPDTAFFAVVDENSNYKLWGFQLTEADADRFACAELLDNKVETGKALLSLNESSTEGELADLFCMLGGDAQDDDYHKMTVPIHRYVPHCHLVVVVIFNSGHGLEEGASGAFFDLVGFYDETRQFIYHISTWLV